MKFTPHQPAQDLLHYILHRGSVGDHVLFSDELIRATFEAGDPSSERTSEVGFARVAETLETLTHLGTIQATRDFITRLPSDLQEQICFHYFRLVEGVSSSERGFLH